MRATEPPVHTGGSVSVIVGRAASLKPGRTLGAGTLRRCSDSHRVQKCGHPRRALPFAKNENKTGWKTFRAGQLAGTGKPKGRKLKMQNKTRN
jgi:hypothetical protein